MKIPHHLEELVLRMMGDFHLEDLITFSPHHSHFWIEKGILKWESNEEELSIQKLDLILRGMFEYMQITGPGNRP